METEIELKFYVSASFLQHIKETINEEKVLQQGQRHLSNTYFDTDTSVLRQHDIGLRIRRFDTVSVQTLKTAGRVVAGLHQRPEYNAELDGDALQLALIPEDAWPASLSVSELAAELKPIFSTDFTRQQWLVCSGDNSQIELAFDVGTVSAQGKADDSICEMELELKSGQIDALFSLARRLADNGNLRLGNLSKAARGYRLAYDYPGDPINALTLAPVESSITAEQGFITILEHALAHWQYHEQIYIERQDSAALSEINQSVRLLRQAFSLFSGLIPRRATALLRQELAWLAGELAWVERLNTINRLCEDKGHFLRKLNAQKQLCSALTLQAEQLPEPEQIVALLNSSRYCHLLLDLSRWLLVKGWQPFLDTKAREKLARPMAEFAQEALTASWHELEAVFSLDAPLDANGYLELQPTLLRNLFSGTCLSALYSQERRDIFRLPWLDVLQGMDDLALLVPIHELVENDAELDDADKAQIAKWLRRKEESLLYAMLQSRQISLGLEPYWTN